MRVRRKTSTSIGLLIVPVICCAVSLYFGYSAVAGPRGILAWSDAEAELAIAKRDLAAVRGERLALQHRISLLDDKALDPDMLEEVARSVLSQGRPGEVAVPRGTR